MTLAKIKFILASVLILGLAAALFLERQASHKLRLELAALQSQVDDLKARSALEDASGSTKVNADELTRLRAEHSELLRLRGEVSRLRSVQAETGKLQAEITRMRATQANFSPNSASQEPVDPEKDVYKSAGIATWQ